MKNQLLQKIQNDNFTVGVIDLGIAYKKNVDDMRESPAVEIMDLLEAAGASLDYCDPHVSILPKMREHYFGLIKLIFWVIN